MFSSNKKNYYSILGVKKNASIEEIEKAYKALAFIYHPDRIKEPYKQEAEEKIKELNEAFEELQKEIKAARRTSSEKGSSPPVNDQTNVPKRSILKLILFYFKNRFSLLWDIKTLKFFYYTAYVFCSYSIAKVIINGIYKLTLKASNEESAYIESIIYSIVLVVVFGGFLIQSFSKEEPNRNFGNLVICLVIMFVAIAYVLIFLVKVFPPV